MDLKKNNHVQSHRTLILEEYPEQNMKFLKEQNIQFLQFGIAGNKVIIT
jgi:tyrosine-protein phosphatase SIW14